MRHHNLLLYKVLKNKRPYVKHRCAHPLLQLTLLEMDIKQIWVEEHRRYAFVLTIIDTFTRVALYWDLAYSIRWKDVRRAWEHVIEHHLQPADILAKELTIEIRSDNGPQFLAKKLREFFWNNHLCQVFTHPYTPQENGHVESFHGILQQAIRYDFFWTLEQLQIRLTLFYEKYNNQRVHSAIAYLPPSIFWQAWNQGLIKRKLNRKRKPIFILRMPRYQLLGNLNPKGASRSERDRLNAGHNQNKVVGAAT
jgi:transposase InsO family protein